MDIMEKEDGVVVIKVITEMEDEVEVKEKVAVVVKVEEVTAMITSENNLTKMMPTHQKILWKMQMMKPIEVTMMKEQQQLHSLSAVATAGAVVTKEATIINEAAIEEEEEDKEVDVVDNAADAVVEANHRQMTLTIKGTSLLKNIFCDLTNMFEGINPHFTIKKAKNVLQFTLCMR